MAREGLTQAYDILYERGTMRDWRNADRQNRAEVAQRLMENMIMRGNVPRNRASISDLYRCLDAAYTPEIATNSVEDIAYACALSMGWLQR